MEPGLSVLSRVHRVALGLVLVLALVARLWYARDGLAPGRNYDEKYSFRNVAEVLDSGSLVPRRLFYLTLSYLPQTALLAAADALGGTVRNADGTFSPLSYYLARLVSSAYGLLSIWLTYLLGRRFLSPNAALIAAALVAAAPRHLVSSTSFKPDALVVLLTVAAALQALAAVERGRLKGYASAGLLAGLGLAAKLTGFVVALPVTVLALWSRPRERSTWMGLSLAGLIAVAVFAVTNPFPAQLRESLAIQRSDYEHRAAVFESDHLMVAKKQLAFLAEEMTPVGLLTVVSGLGLLLVRLRRGAGEHALALRTVAGMVIVFSLMHTLLFTLFRPQNYLPILPFAALAAAAAVSALTARLRLGAFRDLVLGGATVALLALSLGTFLYRLLLPDTWAAAWPATLERLAPLELRQVGIDPRALPWVRPRADGPVHGLEVILGASSEPLKVGCGGGERRGLCLPFGSAGESPELADALVLPAEALPPASLPGRWIAGAEQLTFEPRIFERRGPALRVLLHPHAHRRTVDLTAQVAGEASSHRLSLRDLGEGAVVALELTYAKGPRRFFRLRLGSGQEPLDLIPAGSTRTSRRLLSPRFRVPVGGEVVLVGEGAERVVLREFG